MKYSWSRFSLGEFAWKIESFEFPCLEKKCTVTGIPSGACIHFANFVKKPRKKLDGMKQEKKTFTPCIDHFFPPSPLHWKSEGFQRLRGFEPWNPDGQELDRSHSVYCLLMFVDWCRHELDLLSCLLVNEQRWVRCLGGFIRHRVYLFEEISLVFCYRNATVEELFNCVSPWPEAILFFC